MRKLILCITSLLIANYGVCWATIINIPADYPTIQQGIDASANGDTVLVHPGTYQENITIVDNSVTVASNYIFSGDSLDIVNTVIYGYNLNGPLLNIQCDTSFSHIIGLTINDCADCTGGAIILTGGEIGNCKLKNILGTTIIAANAEISNNEIRNLSGNIIHAYNQVEIRGNELFENNIGNFSIIWADGGGVLVEDNRIFNNLGMIFWCWNSNPNTFRSNIIYNNHFNSGIDLGAIFLTEDSEITAEANIIYNNTGTNNSYLGYFGIDNNAYPANLVNNIIWGNSYDPPGIPLFHPSGVQPSITYTDIQGGWAGEGNIECDPQFCDPDSGNFHLDGNSCCVGAGQDGENMGVYGVGCWSPCDAYVVGDVNGSGAFDGLDIVYGVAYLKGGPAPEYVCECIEGNILHAAGDVNGSCSYNGLDITYSVAYLKGGFYLIPCQDCPPVE